jgi:hypothetical protein
LGKKSVTAVEGWVFPTGAKQGHLEQGTAKTQHSAAITQVNAAIAKENVKREKLGEKLLPLRLVAFEPYVMRHPLTRASVKASQSGAKHEKQLPANTATEEQATITAA